MSQLSHQHARNLTIVFVICGKEKRTAPAIVTQNEAQITVVDGEIPELI